MRQRHFDDDGFIDQLQRSCESEYQAFVTDLQTDSSNPAELAKAARALEDSEHFWTGWEENMREIAALKGERLRTPDRCIDPDILGELDPDYGRPERLVKRHEPTKGRPNSVIKSDNGWTHIYGVDGTLIRAFGPSASEKDFERVKV